jgi:hypothetical protein
MPAQVRQLRQQGKVFAGPSNSWDQQCVSGNVALQYCTTFMQTFMHIAVWIRLTVASKIPALVPAELHLQ